MHLEHFPLGLIPLLPLLGAVYAGFFGARLQRRWREPVIYWPAIVLPWASFVITVVAVAKLAGAGHHTALYHRAWSWLSVGSLQVDVAFQMDRLSAVMALVVTLVGSLIHVYSRGYMKDDPGFWRFFSNMNLFMFAMLVLVLADNFLLMFVGWEGVGLCSYLLIGFWYRETKNAVAGMKAFIVNRIGDYGFSLGLFLLFWGLFLAPVVTTGDPGDRLAAPGGPHAAPAVDAAEPGAPAAADTGIHGGAPLTSVTFREVQTIVEDPARRDGILGQRVLGAGLITVVCLLFFLGAAGKSAQIPLYVWLPDAMAGPTPVSALIHAATMVTAGVYLVARLHFLFAASAAAMTVVATVGALTALFAATIGLFQYDIKKVLAYSTVSQLGFMFLAAGVGAYWVAIFHLMTHAFFKACLFLGSGSVILGCHHEQDMRKMGGLRKLMPITAVTYALAACAIAGFPFFSGFFSKDEILWKAFDSGNLLLPGKGIALWALAAAAALCTSFYMFRSYFLTFTGTYRGGQDAGHGHGHGHAPHESPRSMTVVLVVLAALAVGGGWIGLPILWGLPNRFEQWLEPAFAGSHHLIESAHRGHGAEWGLMALSVAIAIAGWFAARWLFRDGKNPIPARLLASSRPAVRGVYRTVFNKYYVDEFYGRVFVRGTRQLSELLARVDRDVVDGLVNLWGSVGRVVSDVQGMIDAHVVDGAVNAIGAGSVRLGRSLRRLQTGRIQSYVFGLTTGFVILVVIGYLLA
ncbi:MAG TPA: NADH-quinone oxidoreductase subunit L [Candidatus Krumholzibacteria bacterium]|nr:NADH-quinone oxidoreductase subunit L [Candidatus Krumholzibacteria bacterium]HPD71813.1 NADH-quinone oxidoreductase subunit L [Candidatus Krumholzibacteria bacterium]HRY41254.1 NADH-quinone oxidoreductase subunit L [Candidatus Krumholzibacteria bacterium]